jgi:uncharacterized protein YbjT (DUF2867 family)
MASKLKVLVTGATGQQGGAVAGALLNRGHQVRALTRSPDSAAARALNKRGAEIVAGDLNDRDSLTEAARGVDTVFAVCTPYEAGTATETEQGINIVDVAAELEIEHLVYSSVGSADRNTGIPHFDSKFRVEKHLRDSGVPFTIVGPVFFMENWTSPWFKPALKQGTVALALPAGRSLAHVALRDIGNFIALIIERRDQFFGKRFDIASDDLTGGQVAEILSRKIGRRLEFQQIPLDAMRQQSEDWARMFEWFDEVGYSFDLDWLKQEFPEVGWTNFKAWVDSQDWSDLRDFKSDQSAA